MREQEVLQLSRRDLQTVVLDQLLLAVDDVEFPVTLQADVAGAEPAVAEGILGRFGVVVVAVRDNWTFDPDFARVGVVAVVIDQTGSVELAKHHIGRDTPVSRCTGGSP